MFCLTSSCVSVRHGGEGISSAGWLWDAGTAQPVASAWPEDEIPARCSPSARLQDENRQSEGTEAMRTSVNGWNEFKMCEIEQELLKQLRITCFLLKCGICFI